MTAPAPTLPREARLRRTRDIRRVLARGEVHPGREALVRRLANDVGLARLALVTPRAYGKATRRNRFRRLAREAFRHVRHRLGAHDHVLSPRRHLVEPTLEGLRADLLRCLEAEPAPRRPRRPRGGRR